MLLPLAGIENDNEPVNQANPISCFTNTPEVSYDPALHGHLGAGLIKSYVLLRSFSQRTHQNYLKHPRHPSATAQLESSKCASYSPWCRRWVMDNG